MQIKIDDLETQPIIDLLAEHMRDMQSTSPPESVHALDIDALKAPSITFWSAWDNNELLGCGAIKELSPTVGEIKSMRTAKGHLRKGVAANILKTITETAIARSYKQLYLETGSMIEFQAARSLYERYGFNECPPFSDYEEDPNSVFMVREF